MNREISYIPQRVDELLFGVYRRKLAPTLFHILERRTIRMQTYRADLWIIGSSHVLNVETAHGCLGEVLTGSSKRLPEEADAHLIHGGRAFTWERHD